MNGTEALKWFEDIQNGNGVDRMSFPDDFKGEMAKDAWHNTEFAYGIEYGVLIALDRIYNITKTIKEREENGKKESCD